MELLKIKKMKKDLKHGDVTTIAKEVGCSTTTVQMALGGKIDTFMARVVMEYADVLIRQREERIKHLNEVLRPMYKKARK